MQVVAELSKYRPERGTLLTVGVFDGVHLGHRHLISRLTQRASAEGLLSGVVTFSCHPRLLFSPQAELPQLTTVEERAELLKGLGVEIVVPLRFTRELAALSAREFVGLLQEHLRMRELVIGHDFALGRGREGDAATLQALGQELGFGVEVVEQFKRGNSPVSSTTIRRAISKGDMLRASELLGRYFSLSGPVVGGMERGHVLGFPTANIEVDPDHALPADGVYATLANMDGEVYKSVTNVGLRPTFGNGYRTIEVYLLDFDRDIYGRHLRVDFVERLRGEIKFAGPQELSVQISTDVEQARAVLEPVLAGAKQNGH